jgi:hypothetical protein
MYRQNNSGAGCVVGILFMMFFGFFFLFDFVNFFFIIPLFPVIIIFIIIVGIGTAAASQSRVYKPKNTHYMKSINSSNPYIAKPSGVVQVKTMKPEVKEDQCQDCGVKLNQGAVFCQNCGSRVEKVKIIEIQSDEREDSVRLKYCPFCGTNVDDDASYCHQCGTGL